MGIFDRFASSVEKNNTDAVYSAALDALDAKIAEHKDHLASVRADALRAEQRGDGTRASYDALALEAERLLHELREKREALDRERVSAPAKRAVAEARVAMAEASSGVGSTDEARGLSSVRDQVEALGRRASPGMLDANGIPIHGRQEALSRKSAEQRAREELARMKAALLPKEDEATSD